MGLRPWIARVGVGAFAFAWVAILTTWCTDPFTLRGSGPTYFLPVLSWTSNSLLHGVLPRVAWQLGAGWSPFESSQVGLFWPGYLLAALLADLMQHPLWFLRTSAAIHIALAGLVVLELTPRGVPQSRRVGAALVAMVQPAPLILGMQWHDYLASYPAALALTLLLLFRSLDDRRVLVAVAVATVCFFWTAHPQMFIWGCTLIGVATLAARRPPLRVLRGLAVSLASAFVVVVVPMAWLWIGSKFADEKWMMSHAGGALSRHAEPLWQAVPAFAVGNLTGALALEAFGLDVAAGVGLFFCPAVFLVGVWCVRRRAWPMLAFLLFCVLLLAPARTGLMSVITVGPWAGFRWTWKLTMIVLPPLAVAAILGARPDAARDAAVDVTRTPARQWALTALLVIGGLAVSVRGTSFDLAHYFVPHASVGIEGIVDDGAALARALPPHARVALVGEWKVDRRPRAFPRAYVALLGNTPLVVPGLETAHVYEPLENDDVSEAHARLGVPWHEGGVSAHLFDAARAAELPAQLAGLRAVGVTHLVALDESQLPADAATTRFTGADRRSLFIRDIRDIPTDGTDRTAPLLPYPLMASAGAARAPTRDDDGTLHVAGASSLRATRPLVIEDAADGTLIARAEVPTLFFAVEALAVVAAIVMLTRLWRARRSLSEP